MRVLDRILNYFIVRPLLRFFLGSCGKSFRIGPASHLRTMKNIFIGDHFFSGVNCYISTSKSCSIIIGDYVMFGPNVTLLGGNHNIKLTGIPMMLSEHCPEEDKGIFISNDVWLGAGVIVLDGAYISEGTVVAAGSVINKRTEPFSVYGGVPAKLIKLRR